MKEHPGAIGYDLLNEPWADEKTELGPLYEDAARVIRGVDPSAILFVEPDVRRVTGMMPTSALERPKFENFAYAPHLYDPITVSAQGYFSWNPFLEALYERLPRKSRYWNVPLFLGEFGAFAETGNVGAYIDRQYDLLDESLASGAQWNYTPSWSRSLKDGWNDEDYSIIDDEGLMRKNFRIRPFPRRIAGMPKRFRELRDEHRRVQAVEFEWVNKARLGETELFLPRLVLFGHDSLRVITHGEALECAFDRFENFLRCRSSNDGFMRVRVERM